MEISIELKLDVSDLERYEAEVESQLNQLSSGPVEQAIRQWGIRYRSFVQLRFDKYSKGGGDWKPLAASTIRKRRKGKSIEKRIKNTKKKIAKLKHNARTGAPRIPGSRPNPAASSRRKKWSFKGTIKGLQKKFKAGAKSFKQYRKNRAKAKVRNEKLKSLQGILKKLEGANNVSILRDIGLLFTALQPVFTNKPGALEQRIPFGTRVGFGGPAKHKDSSLTIADIAGIHQIGAGHIPKREIIVDPPQSVISLMCDDMYRGLNKLASIVSREPD